MTTIPSPTLNEAGTLNPTHGDYPPELVARLHTVPVLASLRGDALHCLDDARWLRLAPGEVLVEQGKLVRTFWIVLAGALELSQVMTPGGPRQPIYTLAAGASFGEVPLLAGIPSVVTIRAVDAVELLELSEALFWNLMSSCPEVRAAILGNMALRLAKTQQATSQQEKMASLGTLAAGLMHELNNPGAAARRASVQLRDNLLRMHHLTASFAKSELSQGQKQCMFDLQEQALAAAPHTLGALEQSDAEEALAEWMEGAAVADAWKLAPTLVTAGIDADDLQCARQSFPGPAFSDALAWLDALVSSMQLVTTIEESIGRVADLVHAVKSYAYEGRGQRQTVDVNQSIHATLIILGHKLREKQVVLDKSFAPGLPALVTECQGLNQVWTNLLDNAIDAVPQGGRIAIRTSLEPAADADHRTQVSISIADNGSGIPVECQSSIFDPFFTTKPVGVGTGLGLGIVYRIVEQYGGSLRFASDEHGTEFVVRVPVDRENAGQSVCTLRTDGRTG